jgi:hypothetical protein
MKAKEVKKTIEQMAAEAIAKKNVSIFASPVKGFGRYDGIGLEWDHHRDRANSGEILDIKVGVHRDSYKEISFFIAIENYKENSQYLDWTATAEQAYAIKDLLDDMISAFKVNKEGGKRNGLQISFRGADQRAAEGAG